VPVPLDYSNPKRGSITISVTQSPALEQPASNGSLIFNPGGPGESGNQILPVALVELPLAIRQHFNVVSFDPRGTGHSDPLKCGTSLSAVTSALPIPTSSGQALPGGAVFTAMAKACLHGAASIEPFLNTISTARDMDRIRQALGLSKISFYGMSYGTVLGAVYADLFPHDVASMVMDGAVDVNATLAQQAEEEAPAEEQSLLHLFSSCLAKLPCPMGADPEKFYENLTASLTEHPLPAPGHGDDNPVTVGDLDTATLFVISVPDFSTAFYTALLDATHGNGAPLRGLALAFVRDINGTSLVDPLWAITCNDAAAHPSSLEAGNLARTLSTEYPLIGGYSVIYTMGGCISWPAAEQPVTDIHPSEAPPVLVIGNTGDPNTPITEARQLAAIFPSASMVTWRGWGHTWLLSGPSDKCMQGVLTSYLVSRKMPASGTVCN
jgi:pimeloyl-ACP methyl ester carboxylesterase